MIPKNDQDNSRLPIADPALKHEIQDILASGFYLLRFPGFLERFFLESYRNTSLNALKINSAYVVSTYLLLGALLFGQFPTEQLGAFVSCYLATGICLVLVIVLSRISRINRYFHWYTGVCAMLGLAILLNVAPTVQDPHIKLAAYAGSIYATIVIYAMSKMRFYIATFWCLMAGGLHLLLLEWQGIEESFVNFQAYFVASNLIGMGISYSIEHRERAMFLQSLLLDIDKIQQQALFEDLKKLSREDALTGLANRRYFDERLAQEWSRCRRNKKPLTVVLLDVDYFKQYNDHYGHQAGDQCLVTLANALKKEASRTGELVGRYGGEEFIILYPNTDQEQIQISLQRIRQRIHGLAIPHEASDIAPMVTASIGAATAYPVESLHPDKLVSAADKMLYKAKREGRDGWFNTQISHVETQPSQLEILP